VLLMDIGTELASISSDLHALANAISERHINRTTATQRARVLALAVTNVKLYVDRQSGEFGQAYAEGLEENDLIVQRVARNNGIATPAHYQFPECTGADNCTCMKCSHDTLDDRAASADNLSTRLSRAFRQSDAYTRIWDNGKWHERGCICTDCIGAASE
jgi:hypothetical protein